MTLTVATKADSKASQPPVRRGHAAPAIVLLLLAPIIGEVLSGATRLSYLFVLVPQIMVWGCGALIIRELVRRWRGGGTSLLLLGLALAVAEEFIIQQTSLAPLPWLTTQIAYGRGWGVNWLYFLFMLGYETIWIVLVPILVVELLFPDRRDMPWLRARGLVVAAGVFVAGSFIAWYLWVEQARQVVFNAPDYDPPLATRLIGLLAIAALAWAAYARRSTPAESRRRRVAPRPAVVAVAAALLGFPWYVLITLVFAPTPSISFWIPMAAGIAWGVAAFVVIRTWVRAPGWGALHDWALAFGALIVNMAGGYLGSNYWPPIDLYAKIVLNAFAVVCMIALAGRLRRRVHLNRG